MLCSRSCQYALRALTYLSSQNLGTYFGVHEISASEDIPAPILADILKCLAEVGILTSKNGPIGGFRLAHRPENITLKEVVAAIDGPEEFTRCAVGLAECSDTSPCPLHDTWKPLKTKITDYLSEKTLADLATALAQKKFLIEKDSGSA